MSSSTPSEQTPEQTPEQRAASDVVAIVAERLGRDQVFGPPIEKDGTTVVPVARVRAGGGIGGRRGANNPAGSSGAGVVARPVGAFAIGPDGKVAWHPAVDVNKIVLGGQILAGVVAAVALSRRRRRRRAVLS
ncbi:spore germination protein GerW family protein [Pseudonocardia asaccharolytica]|uniref:Sporulation protein n=1 Tax=Pseudonocardia asaccharolytica DSM 44247 = NBRC 16224 TaxID=1123024 RepID=A0A511D020_9PSEU|nr:spore germination protein GerW family protein [Pseudonocardia asaccharolytica]GEL18047.1 hypothetical protein PA7_18840 [Pseudonocardia asaccharolytica DSM 44247 = NBRC 16224]